MYASHGSVATQLKCRGIANCAIGRILEIDHYLAKIRTIYQMGRFWDTMQIPASENWGNWRRKLSGRRQTVLRDTTRV